MVWKKLSAKERSENLTYGVSKILEQYPQARNNDLYLVILYLRNFTELSKYIGRIPDELISEYDGLLEAITRTRRKLNEQGLYLPTDPKILERRRRKAEKMRRVMSK